MSSPAVQLWSLPPRGLPGPPRRPRSSQGRGNDAGRSCVPIAGRRSRAARRHSTVTDTSGGTSTDAAVAARPSPEARVAQFTKQQAEQVEELELEVEGSIPQWLDGIYLRNGPGDLEGMKHLFDGYAMFQKVRVSQGKAYAMHKFLESKAYCHKRDFGEMRWREFSTSVNHKGIGSFAREMAETVLGVVGYNAGVTDNASVNVVPHPTTGRAMALTETVSGTYEIELGTLATIGQIEYSDSVKGSLTTAHPRPAADGSFINLTSEVMGGYHVYRQRAGSLDREEIAYIPHLNGATPAWIHDFAVSKNYAIIVESPLFFNLGALLAGFDTKYVFMDWKPELGTRVHLVHLQTGRVTTKMAPAFFAFHYANAFENEDGSEVYVDMAKFETPEILNQLKIAPLMNFDAPDLDPCHPERMTIRMGAGAGSRISPQDIRRLIPVDTYGSYYELPSINGKYLGRPYRYSYGISAVRPTNLSNAIVKHDLEEGKSIVWHEPGSAPGEPRFVQRPGATDEDDGVVVTLVTGADGKAFFIVLDGKTFQEVARAHLPYSLAYGFHGLFFPSK